MKSIRSSFSPLNIVHRYRAFWWTMKFCWFCKISWPSSLEACSPKSVFRSVYFWASNQSKTVLSTGSSHWASAQSVTCIWTNMHPVAIHGPLAPGYGHPQLWWGHKLLPYGQPPGVIPLRMHLTISGLRWVVIWLSASAMVFLHPFWYSNWMLNLTRPPTHLWPVASRLGVIIILVTGLLSVFTRKGWYSKYSLKCSVTTHISVRNSSLVEW